jgi:hypothetical protein
MVYISKMREGNKMSNVQRVTQNVYSASMHHRGRGHFNNRCRGLPHDYIHGASGAFQCAT